MSSKYTFGIHAFGCTIQVATENRDAHSILERYVFPSLPRIGIVGRHPDLSIRIVRDAREFQLLADDVLVTSASRPIGLVVDLIRVLDEAVVQRLTGLRAVHAGAVVWNEQALLLPGVSHAGKSSLVAELIQRGATYFSDEYALIDADGRVHPYPRPLLLRNGGPGQFPVLASECKALVGHAPAPVGWIFFLEYQPECTWNVASMPQSEAVLSLLRNTPHVLTESPGMVAMFQRAAASAACYAGQRTEAADAVDQILQIMDVAHMEQRPVPSFRRHNILQAEF